MYGGSVTTVSNVRRATPGAASGRPSAALNRERRTVELGPDEVEQPLVDVQDGGSVDRTSGTRGRSGASATDIRSSSPSSRIRRPHESVGLVQREHAQKLRLERAMALVELGERRRSVAASVSTSRRSRPSAGENDQPAAAARGTTSRPAAPAAAPNRRRPSGVNWAGRVAATMAALSQLAADRGDERDGELRGAADPPRRDGLEPSEGREHGPHAGLALGEADSARDLGDELLRQRRAG